MRDAVMERFEGRASCWSGGIPGGISASSLEGSSAAKLSLRSCESIGRFAAGMMVAVSLAGGAGGAGGGNGRSRS
jgi:hypothetical protein